MDTSMRVHQRWTTEEDELLRKEAYIQLTDGPVIDWNRIAARLAGDRTQRDCRKRWNRISQLTKKGSWDPDEDLRLRRAVELLGARWTQVAQMVVSRQADQCAKRWTHSLDPTLDHSEWKLDEDRRLLAAVAAYGRNWNQIADAEFPRRPKLALKNRYAVLKNHLQLECASTLENNAADTTAAPVCSTALLSTTLLPSVYASMPVAGVSTDNAAPTQSSTLQMVDAPYEDAVISSQTLLSRSSSGVTEPSHWSVSQNVLSIQNRCPSQSGTLNTITAHKGSSEADLKLGKTVAALFDAENRKVRLSCDSCHGAKVKCTKERPSCSRCSNLASPCVYSQSRRAGTVSWMRYTFVLENVQQSVLSQVLQFLFQAKARFNLETNRRKYRPTMGYLKSSDVSYSGNEHQSVHCDTLVLENAGEDTLSTLLNILFQTKAEFTWETDRVHQGPTLGHLESFVGSRLFGATGEAPRGELKQIGYDQLGGMADVESTCSESTYLTARSQLTSTDGLGGLQQSSHNKHIKPAIAPVNNCSYSEYY